MAFRLSAVRSRASLVQRQSCRLLPASPRAGPRLAVCPPLEGRCRVVGVARLCSTSSLPAEEAQKQDEELVISPTRGQLGKLGVVSAIPFVGFGFMDNVIMIVAGDAIDASIGTKLGVSTMAAAGLGNTLSDCVGLYTGDWIEGLCKKAGVREPKLTEAQLELREVRWTKTSSSVLGLAFGCILGMFPLAVQVDRKPLYFTEGQEEIYETLFRPHGVSLQHFFDIMRGAKTSVVEEGTLLAAEGKQLDKVFMLCKGSAIATGKKVMMYGATMESADETGDSEAACLDAEAVRNGATLRGRIIGGTCLVDLKHRAREKPYPYEVRTTSKVTLIEWNVDTLQEVMEEDPAIESAMVSILYADLAESMRRSKKAEHQLPLTKRGSAVRSELKHDEDYYKSMKEYKMILEVAIADDFIHPAERKVCEEFRRRRGLSIEDHRLMLRELGWTADDFNCGSKNSTPHAATRSIEDMRRRIPEMLKAAGISARVVEQ